MVMPVVSTMIAPLTEASGAVVVDTTGMSIDEVVDHVIAMLEAKA